MFVDIASKTLNKVASLLMLPLFYRRMLLSYLEKSQEICLNEIFFIICRRYKLS